MRLRELGYLAVFSFLVGGMVVAMLSYAQGIVDLYRRDTLGLDDGARVLRVLSNTPLAPTGEDQLARLGSELHDLLVDESVTIAANSFGRGPAALGSFDTAGLFPWTVSDGETAGLSVAAYRDAGPQVLLVRDSFTAAQWEQTGRATFLSPERVVVGEVDPTAVPERTQYVYSLFSAPLSAGRYLVSATDPALVDRVAEFFTEAGFHVVDERREPLARRLATSPTMVAFAAMVAAAFVSLGLVIVNRVHQQGRRMRILWLFGATAWDVLRAWAVAIMAVIAVGTSAGVFGTPIVFDMVTGIEIDVGLGTAVTAGAVTFVGVTVVTVFSFLFGAWTVSRGV